MPVATRKRRWTEGAREKPEGGFRFITVVQLCLAWWAYRQSLIRLRDLRVWFACHEAAERRCMLARDREPEFTIGELAALTGVGRDAGGGGERSIRESLRRLQTAGLLSWSPSEIRFASSPDSLPVEDLTGFWAMLEGIENNRRKVPVPRRVLRFLAGGARAAVIATTLGHLLRCLYYRRGLCIPVGACKASWVARVFGIDLRRAKDARAHLIELGLLLPQETAQWAMNRHGRFYAVNLQWDRPHKVPPPAVTVDNSAVGEGSTNNELPPLPPQTHAVLPPPESDLELPSGSKNQEPGSAPPSGFYASKEEEQKSPLPAPDLRNVLPEDLHDTRRLLELFDQAQAASLVQGELDRLRFVSVAEHARTIGSRNPCGLFVYLVRRQLWHFATADDEDAANRRLKEHLYGISPERSATPRSADLNEQLSQDARYVQAAQRVLQQQGFRLDQFSLVSRALPEWTRERWDAACCELDAFRLRQAQRNGMEGCSNLAAILDSSIAALVS